MKLPFLFFFLFVVLICCTKKQGKNPALAFTDASLRDSCAQTYHRYYKNDAVALLSGVHGPHGTFKLRFNSVAYNALTDNGKLPAGGTFPEGSLIVKDIYSGSDIVLYALMYKKAGSWLWSEVRPDGEVLYSVNANPGTCIGCHSQSGNRDLAVSFAFY